MSGSDNYTSSAPPLGFDQAWIDDQLKNGSGTDLLTAQILSQKTYDKWTGEGHGSVLANARSMAQRLSAAGIKRLEDFGQRTVPQYSQVNASSFATYGQQGEDYYPTGYVWRYPSPDGEGGQYWVDVPADVAAKLPPPGPGYNSSGEEYIRPTASVTLNSGSKQEFYNKATGQPVAGDAQSGNTFDKTYAGDGSTTFNVQFNEMGMPIFYSGYGGSSSDWGSIAPILSIASFIPGVAPFAMAISALGSAYNGNYVGAALSALGAANAYGTEFLNTSIMDPSVPFDQASAALDTASGTLAQNLGNIRTATQAVGVLNAIDKGNLSGIISGLTNLAPQVGITIPTSIVEPLNVAATAAAISKGDWAGALDSARMLTDNPAMRQNAQLASKAAKLVSAVESGNPAAIFSSAVGFAQSNNLGASAIKGAAAQTGVKVDDATANALATSPDAEKYANSLLKAEERDPNFSPSAYLFGNSDLKNAFGDNVLSALDHYTNYGIGENRTVDTWEEVAAILNPNFNAKAYAEKYGDLKEAFGDDAQALAKHFAQYGITEGRDPTVAQAQPEAPKDSSLIGDLQTAGLTESPDFAQPGAVDEAMAAFQKGQDAAALAQAKTPDVQEAKSNYTGEYSGMYFDPTYVDSDGNTGAYREIPTSEEGATTPAIGTPAAPAEGEGTGATAGGDATVPTAEEQQGSIDELLNELASYEQQPTGGTGSAEETPADILDALAGAGLTEQPSTPAEVPAEVPAPETPVDYMAQAKALNPNFDAQAYLDRYSDLKAAYGDDLQAAAQHYATWGGPQEGRDPTAVAPAQDQTVEQLQDAGLNEQPTPEAPVTATPETPTTPAGVTAAEVQTIVDNALQSNPSLTEDQVRGIVQSVVDAAPEGLTADTVKQLVDSGIAGMYAGVQNQIGDVQTTLGQQIGDVQSQLQEQIKAAQEVGLKGDAALQSAIDSVAANTNATREQVLSQLGATEDQLRQDFADQLGGVQTQIGDVQTGLQQQIGGVQSNVDQLAADLGLTKEELLARMNATEDQLSAELAQTNAQFGEKLGTVQSQLSDAIAAAKAAGMQGDEALQSAIDSVAADVGSTREDVLGQLGKTETQLRQDFSQQLGGVQEQLGQQLGDVQSQLQEQIQAAQDIGLKGDAALQAAIDSVAADVGVTRDEVLSRLGTTEAQLRQDFADQLGGVQEQLGDVQTGLQEQIGGVRSQLADAIEAAKAAGLQGDAALQSAIDAVAADVGSTREEVLGQLGKTETQLRQDFADQIGGVQEQLAGVGADLQSKYGELSAAQQQLANDLQSTGISLQDAIDLARQASAEQIQQVQTDLAGQLGDVQTGLQEQIGGVQSDLTAKYNALTDVQKQLANDLQDTGTSLQEAIDFAAQASAAQIQQVQQELGQKFETGLGTVTQQMQEQYAALTAAQKAEVDARTQMGQSMSDAIAASQASTGQQISDLESSLTGQIGAQGQQFQTLLQQYRDLGLSEDAAMRQTIDDLGGQLGGQIGATEEKLGSQISQQGQQFQTLLQQYRDLGLSEDAAMRQTMADMGQNLSGQISGVQENLTGQIGAQGQQFQTLLQQYRDLGMSEAEANRQAVADMGSSLSGQISTQGQQFQTLLQQYRDIGMSENEAMQQTIADMGQDFSGQLGATKEELGQQITQQGVNFGNLFSNWQTQQQTQAQQQAAAQAAAQAAQAAQNTALQQQIAKQGESSNMLALLGLLGNSGQQTQQAVQTPVADVKSFEDLGYGDLFGGKLQFSDGGSVDDLLNLLKG